MKIMKKIIMMEKMEKMSNTELTFDQRVDNLLKSIIVTNEQSNKLVMSAYLLSREVYYTAQEVNKTINKIEALEYE
jgi:hypothetical protein